MLFYCFSPCNPAVFSGVFGGSVVPSIKSRSDWTDTTTRLPSLTARILPVLTRFAMSGLPTFRSFAACGMDTPIWGMVSACLRSGFGSGGVLDGIRMPVLELSGMVIIFPFIFRLKILFLRKGGEFYHRGVLRPLHLLHFGNFFQNSSKFSAKPLIFKHENNFAPAVSARIEATTPKMRNLPPQRRKTGHHSRVSRPRIEQKSKTG